MSLSLTTPATSPTETLTFPDAWASQLEPYLPPARQPATHPSQEESPGPARPFLTLTYAQSLDSHLALAPGVRTALSGPSAKAMTHFLRARHAALLVGAGTALADDPALNCRLSAQSAQRSSSSSHQQQHDHPRPVVLDPRARWAAAAAAGSRVVRLAREGRGRAPWVLHAAGAAGAVAPAARAAVEAVGGRFLAVPAAAATDAAGAPPRLAWGAVLAVLAAEGVASVMVEGGGAVVNGLLELAGRGEVVVDAVVVTVAPVWLGAGGVRVAPGRGAEGAAAAGPRLGDVRWVPMGEDVVLCGRIRR